MPLRSYLSQHLALLHPTILTLAPQPRDSATGLGPAKTAVGGCPREPAGFRMSVKGNGG